MSNRTTITNKLLTLISFSLFAALIFSYLGIFHYLPDLFSHFKLQYLAIAFLLFLLNLVRRNGMSAAGVSFLVVLICMFEVKGVYIDNHLSTSKSNLDVFHANVLTSNKSQSRLFKEIEKLDPTIVGLQEVDTAWTTTAVNKLTNYPYQIVIPRSDNFGIALFSKIPIKKIKQLNLGRNGIPTIVCEVEVDNKIVKLIYTHPFSPMTSEYFEDRNIQFEALSHEVDTKIPTIFFGDLNVTPWSLNFKKLLDESKLIHSSKSIVATWPSSTYLMSIPIDHFLHKNGLSIVDVKVLGDIGSDHFPLYARYRVN